MEADGIVSFNKYMATGHRVVWCMKHNMLYHDCINGSTNPNDFHEGFTKTVYTHIQISDITLPFKPGDPVKYFDGREGWVVALQPDDYEVSVVLTPHTTVMVVNTTDLTHLTKEESS